MRLSSTLSKTRRRIYGLIVVGAAAALAASTVGALIVVLGHSQPDVIQPFWECGQYVMLLGVFNLAIYAALLWQVRRLSRREGRREEGGGSAAWSAVEKTLVKEEAGSGLEGGEGEGVGSGRKSGKPSGEPRRISRQVVRRNAGSLKPEP